MALVGRYGVEKAVGGGIARVGALADQMDGDTDDGAADHGQIQNAGEMAHAAAFLAGADIRAQVQAGFAAPVSAQHRNSSQGDIASLKGEDVDCQNHTVSFSRKKTGVPVIIHLGNEALNLFKDLPGEGLLFPYLSTVRAGDRATEFGQICRQLGMTGVTLHSYKYAWAERALKCGYAERFAMENLGHNSKAVHRAYAKQAQTKIPSLEEFELLAEGQS